MSDINFENEKDITAVNVGDIITQFGSWLQHGMDMGWVTPPFCHTHEGDPYMSEEEEKEWEDGGDPCTPVIKLIYESDYVESEKYQDDLAKALSEEHDSDIIK